MKKRLLIFIVLICSFAHAESQKIINQKVLFANIYADLLIDQFDKELRFRSTLKDLSLPSLMSSNIYSKIIASREYIEHYNGESFEIGQKSLLEVTNQNLYQSVVNEINHMSRAITHHKNLIKNLENESVLFPSITSAGNVTGNTFPKNVWSLTFDDGPHKTRTKAAIDNLYLHSMKATFFVLMRQINKYPQALDDIMNSDMELALHSYNHLDLNKADDETLDYEVSQSKKELEVKSSKVITLFRLPYGSGMRNSNLRQKISNNKMLHIFWNVDTLDWKDKDPESIFQRTKLQMSQTPNQSGIILFHDIHKQSVIASEMVMNYMTEQEKTVCVVGEVVNYINSEPQSCL